MNPIINFVDVEIVQGAYQRFDVFCLHNRPKTAANYDPMLTNDMCVGDNQNQ